MSKQKNKPTLQTIRMAMPKGDVGVGFMSIDILVNEKNKAISYIDELQYLKASPVCFQDK